MNQRKKASEVAVGDLLLSVGKRQINARVLEVKVLPVGSIVSGPRGGQYRLLQPRTCLVTAHARPVMDSTATVTVYQPEED